MFLGSVTGKPWSMLEPMDADYNNDGINYIYSFSIRSNNEGLLMLSVDLQLA